MITPRDTLCSAPRLLLVVAILLLPLVLNYPASCHGKNSGNTTIAANTAQYWPTKAWRTSAPEQQGMRSEQLLGMFNEIEEEKLFIKSVLVTRHGYIVAEASRGGEDARYPIYSSTKSISSAVFGIALEKGIVQSLDQPVLSFFPDLAKRNADPVKKDICLSHLLTMTSGIHWPEIESSYTHHNNPEYQMEMSANWAEYVLNREMELQPGEQFNYNSGTSHLLFAVLASTGLDVKKFAQDNLFSPLGIQDDNYYWSEDSQGIPNSSHGLAMRPRDCAKIGYLYLRQGLWDGKQVVPEKWVESSSSTKVKMNWNGFLANDYGYQWYIQPFGYHSMGYQGQYIFILPKYDIVAVFTAELQLHQLDEPVNFIKKYIIPAVQSATPLPDNNKARKELGHAQVKFSDTPYW